MKLTPQQRKILSAAMQIPGASYADIARETKSKLHTVRYVMQQFINQELLQPYYDIRYSKIGLRLINIFFSVSPNRAKAALKLLENDPRVVWLTEQTGNPRYELTATIKDPLELDRLLTKVAQQTGAHFQDRLWAIETDYYWFGGRYLGAITKQPILSETFPAEGELFKLSELDRRLLDCKRGGPKTRTASTAELARFLKVPHTTVAYHLKKLTDSGVLSPSIYYMDIGQSGMSQFQLVLMLNSTHPKLEEQLLKFCGENSSITALLKGFGGWDYKIILQAESASEGLEVRDALETSFLGVFSNILLLTRRRIISGKTDLTNHPEFKNQ